MIIGFYHTNDIIRLHGSVDGVDFKNIDLHRADFEHTNLSNSSFTHVNLRGAIMSISLFRHCNFNEANMIDCYSINSDLSYSVFCKSLMMGAVFDSSDMSFCDFTDSNVDGVSFNNVNLCSSKLLFSNYEKTNFTGAIYDAHTEF